MSYSDYNQEKKIRFLINLGRHVSWTQHLGNLSNQMEPFDGNDIGDFFVSPKFIMYSIWMAQAQILLESFHKRDISFPELEIILSEEERAVIKQFRDYNQHVSNDIADDRFIKLLNFPEIAEQVQKAVNAIDQWIQTQPESHLMNQMLWEEPQGED